MNHSCTRRSLGSGMQHPFFKKKWNLFFAGLLFILSQGISTIIFAENHDKNQALSISAAKAEIDEPNGWAVYSGDVILQQGSLSIECDKLQIFRSKSGIDKVIASGNPARYSQSIEFKTEDPEASEPQSIQASAQQITYKLESRSIELEGDAQVKQGDNTFEGYAILYQIDNRKIIARSQDQKTTKEGAQRVKIILPIRDQQKTSLEAAE